MKHLHFTQSIEALQGGGLGKAAVDLHKAFIANATDSFLVSTCERQTSDSIPHSFISRRTGFQKCFYSPEIRKRAKSWGKDFNTFHGHGFYVYPNWAIGGQAIANRKLLVYHPHGFLEPWILGRSRFPKKLSHLLFENRNFNYAHLWRALTLKEADQIRAFGIKAPIVIAANGVHLEEYDLKLNEDLVPQKSRKRILFLARIHPKKGLKLLFEIWPSFTKYHRDWEIIVAGPDERGHRGELEKLASTLNITDSVRFVGTVTGQSKLALLKSSDLFILPSYSEGFSVAILEAMACSIPVLATTGCNFRELQENNAGWVCEPNTTSLSKQLEIAMERPPEELRDIGKQGRLLVEKQYTWKSIAGRIIEATNEQRR